MGGLGGGSLGGGGLGMRMSRGNGGRWRRFVLLDLRLALRRGGNERCFRAYDWVEHFFLCFSFHFLAPNDR